MKNFQITTTCMMALTITSVFAEKNKKAKIPNVILINADDLGYGDIACNGSKTIHTPNIDLLAKKGIRFSNFHCTASTSTPSRYSMLTGEYSWRKQGTGIATGDAGSIIRPERFTLADVFKNAGYKTGVIGKWHLGLGDKTGTQDWNGHITPGPSDIGFDYSFILAATGDRVPCVYVENERIVNLDHSDPISVSYEKNFHGEPTGASNPELLKLLPSHKHDFSIVNGISRIGYMKGGKKALWVDEDMADVITGKAVNYINENKENTFFLYFATQDIHVPRVPHSRFVGTSGMGARGDAIMEFDWSVGEIMKTIKKLGLEKNTIIILTSDNGPVIDDGYQDKAVELLGEHKPSGPLRAGKYGSFEGGSRVPGIISWPSKIKPGVSNEIVSQIDLLRSFANFLQVQVPQGAAPDSEDHFNSFINGSKGREYLVTVNINMNLSIQNSDWKMINEGKGGTKIVETNLELGNAPYDQLFNLKTDLGEKNNVADKYPEIVKQMKDKLLQIKELKKL